MVFVFEPSNESTLEGFNILQGLIIKINNEI